jgi:Leucine-rich repeat (LRR) protein
VSYNRISDVSHLSYHQTLRSLDLEGNALAEIEQIEYLETVENLEYVNLEHNPVA